MNDADCTITNNSAEQGHRPNPRPLSYICEKQKKTKMTKQEVVTTKTIIIASSSIPKTEENSSSEQATKGIITTFSQKSVTKEPSLEPVTIETIEPTSRKPAKKVTFTTPTLELITKEVKKPGMTEKTEITLPPETEVKESDCLPKTHDLPCEHNTAVLPWNHFLGSVRQMNLVEQFGGERHELCDTTPDWVRN